MPRGQDEPGVFFPDGLREYLSRIYLGHWIGVEPVDAPPVLMRVDRSADGEHLVCTALVIAAEIGLDADVDKRTAITSSALRQIKLPELLRFLEEHPRLDFPRAFRVREPLRHPGSAGHDDAFYRKWSADYRKIAKSRKRRPTWRDMAPIPRSTFYRYRQEAMQRGCLKEHE